MMTLTDPFIVAVTGKSGSGKTALAEGVARKLNELSDDLVLILPLDCYYLDLSHLSVEERAATDFDQTETLDWELLKDQLEELRAGRAVERPVYLFDVHTRGPESTPTPASDVIIIEGLFAFDERIEDMVHLKVYIDIDDDAAYQRRLRRDVCERGRTPETVESQFFRQAAPAFRRNVEPLKGTAGVVVDGRDDLALSVNKVIERIREEMPTLISR